MVSGIDLRKFLNLKFIILLVIVLIFPLNANSENKKPWLGIEFQPITKNLNDKYNLDLDNFEGIYITGVMIKSAADDAGILPDDILVSFDNNAIKTGSDLGNYLKLKKPGQSIKVKIKRNGKYLSKYVYLQEFPTKDSLENFKLKRSKKIIKNYVLENAILTFDGIKNFYPKYFQSKLIKKYQNKIIVVCVAKNQRDNILKLNDEIISIDGKSPNIFYYTNKPVLVKINRNNKILKKTIIPIENNISKLRHDCVTEYKDFDCAMDYSSALNSPRKSEEALSHWKKTYKCIKDYPTIPFSNIISKEDKNLKIDIIASYLGFLQYESPTKDLNEIKKILKIAKLELKEFEKFKKIYPNHKMKDSYLGLIESISRATSWATGSYNENLKSSQKNILNTDKDTVEIVKQNLENLIKTKGLNHIDSVKYLTRNSKFLRKGKEIKYLIKKYEEFKYKIDWNNSDFSPYLDNIYSNLSYYYSLTNDIEKLSKNIDESLEIVENNYNRLYFKNAYTEFLVDKVQFLLSFSKTDNQIYDKYKNVFKKAENHLRNLDKLSVAEKNQMIKIDKDYYLDLMIVLYLDFLLENSLNVESGTVYPLKMLEFIKANKEYTLDTEYAAALSTLLQSSIIEDDLSNFNLANNELTILFAKSSNNKRLLDAIRPTFSIVLQSYYHNGFYKKFSELINFYDKTYIVKDSNTSDRVSSVDYFYFLGAHYLLQNNYEEAKKIFEGRVKYANVGLVRDTTIYNIYDIIVNFKFVPDLYKIYSKTNNFTQLNNLNYKFLSNDLNDLKKKDLKIISNSLSYAKFKIFNSYLKYFSKSNNQKKIKIIKNYILKSLDSDLKKIYNSKLILNEGMTEFTILKELSDIALILINNLNEKDGLEILNKLNPYIIKYYQTKSKAMIWRPNLEDNFFSFVYLTAAEKFPNDKSFFKKAYDVAQISKNTFTSRDLNKAILTNKFNDKDGFIKKYEKLERELAVNLRSSQFIPKETTLNNSYSEKLNNKNRNLQNEIALLRKDIEKNIPEYFKITNVKKAKINNIQKKINNNEAILDYYFFNDKVFVVTISKDYSKIISKDINLNDLTIIVKNIRNTLIPENGNLKLFAVNESYNLNKEVFLFLNDTIQNYKNIIVIPDGPLNSMPLHALAYSKNNDCLDCRNVKFNLDHHNFNYYPSIESFSNIDIVDEEFKKISLNTTNKIVKKVSEETIDVVKQPTLIKQFKKLKSKVLKNDKLKTVKSKSIANTNDFYLGIGDPNLYSKIQAKKFDTSKKVTMLRSLFNKDKISSQSIKEIYGPVDGSADEINQVADYLSPLKSKILLRENAKETNLKKLDLSSYKIIHFATHGEVSGALTGINEPFLVLSPPNGHSTEDGLLTMSEIMLLDTNANLVVLSACNTASGDEVGSEGFSGLAKSFFMSGSKSILVSNWYVETYSAKEIVINLFKNLKDNPNFFISDALNLTMSKLKNEKERSHPLFWAPFVVVGKNQQLFF